MWHQHSGQGEEEGTADQSMDSNEMPGRVVQGLGAQQEKKIKSIK